MISQNRQEDQDPKTRRYIMMKSIMDIGMGLLYIGVGFVILFAYKFRLTSEFSDSYIGKFFAALIMLYGAWRIYRGIKKRYLKENE
ncbi:hypothetical protein BH09BAC2_BH09BAC2_21870 [soil metagenome]